MSKKKLAFVDHSFHQTSNATAFLINLLQNHYDLTIFWDDAWRGALPTNLEKIASQGFETILLFQQMAYSREELQTIASSINLVLIPMFDHTYTRPFEFWEKFKYAKIISFSRQFHKKLKRFGLNSRYFQYFPSPHDFSHHNVKQQKLSGFFWQRTDQITWNHIKKLIETTDFEHIHIHTAVDPPGFPIVHPPESDRKKYRITVSQWFPVQKDYLDMLDQADVYFAPRAREGVGMAFLEAMAKGKCVVAPDNPTMNEYIIHGKTGLLYDPTAPAPMEFSNIAAVADNARKFIEHGHRRWLEKQKDLIEFIDGPASKPALYKYLPSKASAAVKRSLKHYFPALVNSLKRCLRQPGPFY